MPSLNRRKSPEVKQANLGRRRAVLQNAAIDANTREGVSLLNRLPLSDTLVGEKLGVTGRTIGNWRRGITAMTPFMLECVKTLARAELDA